MVSAAAFHRSFITAFLRACAAFAVIIAFSVCTAAAGAFNVPFSYYADHQDLSSVLMNFARTQGYGASVTEKVRGTVSGRFQDVDPMTFLGGMESAFDINWYVLGSTVYFYHSSEAQKTLLSPRAGSAQQMLAALRSSAVFSPQLPPTLGAGGDVIAVSGPPDYLDQIRMAAAAFENSLAEQTVMRVFPLKYAWAEDITVSSMDKTITVPGIASILRAMVTGAPGSPARVTQERASVEKLGGKGLASVGSETQSLAPTPSPYASPATGMSGIMADPRVNAVIISDASYRMPFYEQVIRDLDKPVELVEIHAAIVDIDTDFKRDLGFTWQGGKQTSSGTGWSFGGTVTGSKESGTGFPSAAGIIDSAGMTLSTIYTHGADFFLSRIQALEANNEARVLGRPSVLTVDNIQATLETPRRIMSKSRAIRPSISTKSKREPSCGSLPTSFAKTAKHPSSWLSASRMIRIVPTRPALVRESRPSSRRRSTHRP